VAAGDSSKPRRHRFSSSSSLSFSGFARAATPRGPRPELKTKRRNAQPALSCTSRQRFIIRRSTSRVPNATLVLASSGTVGFRGAARATPFAAWPHETAGPPPPSTASRSRGEGQGPGSGREKRDHARAAGTRPVDQGDRGRHPAAPQRLPPPKKRGSKRPRRVPGRNGRLFSVRDRHDSRAGGYFDPAGSRGFLVGRLPNSLVPPAVSLVECPRPRCPARPGTLGPRNRT